MICANGWRLAKHECRRCKPRAQSAAVIHDMSRQDLPTASTTLCIQYAHYYLHALESTERVDDSSEDGDQHLSMRA
jgi:hypothetical protein